MTGPPSASGKRSASPSVPQDSAGGESGSELRSPKRVKTLESKEEEDPFDDGLDDQDLLDAVEAVENSSSPSQQPPSSGGFETIESKVDGGTSSTKVAPANDRSSSSQGSGLPARARERVQATTTTTTTTKTISKVEDGLIDFDDPLALERQTMSKEWFERLEPEMRKDYFKKLKKFLSEERSKGKIIYPPTHLIHSWSRVTPLGSVKVVVVGQDPYHGPNQACGHSFSVPKGVAVPGSLRNIYKELSQEYGGSGPSGFKAPSHGNLEGWARQGVLLLNACLTVEASKAGSHHGKGWENLTKEVLRLVAETARKGDGRTKGEEARKLESGGKSSNVFASSKTAAAAGSSPSATAGGKGSKDIMSMFAKVAKKQQGGGIGGGEKTGSERGSEDNGKAPSQEVSKDGRVEEDDENGSPACPNRTGKNKGVVFLVWGLPAAKTLAEAGITEKSPNVLILKSAHPSPLSAHRGFLGNGHFEKANRWLEDEGRYGKGGGIRWGDL